MIQNDLLEDWKGASQLVDFSYLGHHVRSPHFQLPKIAEYRVNRYFGRIVPMLLRA